MSSEQWELAALTKQPFEVYYGKDEDIQVILEKHANEKRAEAEPVAA
jgi:hypothetical protein